MKFLVVTNAPTLRKNNRYVAYAPYVYEMNLWFSNVQEIQIVSPTTYNKPLLTIPFEKNEVNVTSLPNFNIKGIKNKIQTLFKIPIILWRIYNAMRWADHIHLRCPGNIGLLGCLVQILFPGKPKTVKYAGNWDPNSKQPWSYKLQQKILSNTFLTKNCKVLVYGKWENQTKNILPFFTASYHQTEIEKIPNKNLKETINLIFVGAFSKGKQPLKSVQVTEQLYKKGYNVKLNMYGNGTEFQSVKKYITENNLQEIVILHDNQPKEVVKKAFQKSHFLVFISKSEGWPKVVAEAMFWGCLPIATKVSCVPYMLNYGKRGSIVSDNETEITQTIIEKYIAKEDNYNKAITKAINWSQQFTLEKFDTEIKKLL